MQFKEALEECKKYDDNIIDNIKSILNKNNVEFSIINDYELFIKKKSLKSIKKILNEKELSLDKSIFKMMISIKEVNKNIYIRQKL